MNGEGKLVSSGVSPGDSQFQLLMAQLTVLTNGMNEIRALITVQNRKIDECIENIATLKSENSALKDKVLVLEAKLGDKTMTSIYNECSSRVAREKNVLFYGIDDSYDCSDIVTEIITGLIPVNTPKISGVFRLGKSSSGKSRPIKAELTSKQDAIDILKRKNKLDVIKYPGIKIKNDYTPTQKNELAAIYRELNQRRANGENLMLKFVAGQPTIIPTTQKRPREEEESPNKNTSKVNKSTNPGHSKNFS